MAMRESTFMSLMKLLPKSALSTVVGKLVRAPVSPALHRAAMRRFANRYNVELGEAERGFDGYENFSEFFARRLKPGLRPIDPGENVVVSPVDGRVSQLGNLQGDLCVQAKGISFPVGKLLGDEASAHRFHGGAFATLYLSPRDYHRIHAPLPGVVLGYSYLPGEFWPVNPASVRLKEALFCVNERLVTFFQTPTAGLLALVSVGATCVSRIRAAYDETVATHAGGRARIHRYEKPLSLQKGDELARFEMGSTVILLFEPNRVRWDEGLVADSAVRMGKRMGEVGA